MFNVIFKFNEILLLCLASVVFCYLLYKFIASQSYGELQKTKTIPEKNLDQYNFCSSPNCLRCSTNSSNVQLKSIANDKKKVLNSLPRLQKWSQNLDINLQNEKQKPTIFCLPDLDTFPVVDASFYKEDVAILESNFAVIKKEIDNLLSLKNECEGWKTNTTLSGKWSVFCLFNQGCEIPENTSLCPKTTYLVKSLPNFMNNCAFGNACFSILDSGTSIFEHYGPCNVRIRCHLGLQVSANWKLNVNDYSLAWKDQQCILFDDSFLHSVSYNNDSKSDQPSRIILMVDLWHYNLNANEKPAICKIFPPR